MSQCGKTRSSLKKVLFYTLVALITIILQFGKVYFTLQYSLRVNFSLVKKSSIFTRVP
jgi:hypothetical protein